MNPNPHHDEFGPIDWSDLEKVFSGDYTEWANSADCSGQGGLVSTPPPRGGSLRSKLYNLDEAELIPPPRPLLRGILDKSTVAILAGKFGTYKTFVSIAWACSIATGVQWNGHNVSESGTVLYIAAEGASGIRQRVLAWQKGTNIKVPPEKFLILNGRAKLNDPIDRAELLELVEEIRPILVVIDTLHQCSPGADEDGSKDAGSVLATCFDIRDLGATVLLNHHTGHSGKRSRGSSSWEDDVDASWVIELADEEDRSIKVQRTLKHRKVKDGRLGDDMPIILEEVDLGFFDDEGYPVRSAYIEAGEVPSEVLPGSLSVSEIVRRLDDLRIPLDAGRDKCSKALKEAYGTVGKNAMLVEAVKQRKAQGQQHLSGPPVPINMSTD